MTDASPPDTPPATPAELREQMVTTLVERAMVTSPAIIAALRTVPRHLVDGIDPQRAYDPFYAAVTKRGPDGISLSSVSAPQIQALQLEQARIAPGHRVLEVGSGGVNAAYLAELVGPDGLVVTLDIDPEITDRARAFLTATGHDHVQVATGDAALGVPALAPFDRIVVTVEITDVPDTWWDQLTDDARVVAPVRWRAQSRSVALARHGDTLIADDLALCGFVPLQGLGEDRRRVVTLHDAPDAHVTLMLDDDHALDAAALGRSLLTPGRTHWTGVTLAHGQPYDLLDLWLATVLDPTVMTGDQGALAAGLVPSWAPLGWPVLVEGASMAYRTVCTLEEQRWELGVIAHGPAGDALARRYVDAVQGWDPRARPRLTVTRGRAAAPPQGVHRTVQRRHSALTVSWGPQ